MIVAGFDEAGYGPKLGPLTVGFTAFEVEADVSAGVPDLFALLEGAVRREAKGDAKKVWVADSKLIKPKKNGLAQLELGVLSFLKTAGQEPAGLGQFLGTVGEAPGRYEGIPWYRGLTDLDVPALAWPGEIAARAARIEAAAAPHGVRFLAARARAVPADQLNRRFQATNNKSAVLGETFVELLKELRALGDGPLAVVCDKHGGKNQYARLLGRAFPMCPIDTAGEGQAVSAYRVKTPQGMVYIAFQKEAELGSLPVALASMTCKYLRERFMERMNAWFQERCPGLKATAGYAQDAKRFLADVQPSLPKLGVSLDTLVRAR